MKKNLKIIFATFSPWIKGKRSPTNGMIEPMVYYFTPKTKRFVLIDQPHPGSDKVIPMIEIYENGKYKKSTQSSLAVSWLYPVLTFHKTLKTSIAFKVRDFLSVLDFVFRDNNHYHIFIGLESINTLAGILLRKFGFVDKVVYYVTDFSLHRYNNFFLNKLYLLLDRLAFQYSDHIWDVSRAMMPARIKAGLNPKIEKSSIYVPISLFSNQINSSGKEKKIPMSLVYAGTLKKENGPDLAILTLKKVLREVPQARLHIFTDGEDIEIQALRDLIDRLGLHDKVFFHGLLSNETNLIKDLRHFMIGLAPYKALPESPRWWADATRIRLYLAAGLPVVTTQVPPISQDLIETKSGLVVKDRVKYLSAAVISLLRDKNLYRKIKQNAIIHAKNNTWDKVYSKALKNTGIALGI